MREELKHSNIKGSNPFKDARVRRRSIRRSIRDDHAKVMRGHGGSHSA